jgi:hypothetical protein
MLAAGLKPIPVFQRGGTRAELEALTKISDVVGVGGIAGRLRSNADRHYLHQVITLLGRFVGPCHPARLRLVLAPAEDARAEAAAEWPCAPQSASGGAAAELVCEAV